MVKKGIVSSISGSCARVTFPDNNNTVSGELQIASHVVGLLVGSPVAVLFFRENNLNDGLIVGTW